MTYEGPVFYKHTNAQGEGVYQAVTGPDIAQTAVVTVHIFDATGQYPDRLDVVATVVEG